MNPKASFGNRFRSNLLGIKSSADGGYGRSMAISFLGLL
jgi:hypothetical protein